MLCRSQIAPSAEQMLSKYWANTHQSFFVCFLLRTRRPEQITAPQNNTVSISRHFKHFIFLLSKFFCWANFLLSKCSASTDQIPRKCKKAYMNFNAKFGGCRSKMVDIWVLWTCFYFLQSIPECTGVYQGIPECTKVYQSVLINFMLCFTFSHRFFTKV